MRAPNHLVQFPAQGHMVKVRITKEKIGKMKMETERNFQVLKANNQIANIRWIIEKTREFQKNIYFCFIDYAKAFGCMDHNKLWKILQEMAIPDHLTCLLRKEATVRMDMEQQTGSK